MQKVFIATETNSYGEDEILGVFSSREKAEATIRAIAHLGTHCAFGSDVAEYEIDASINDVVGDLEQELAGYEEAKTLLDELKES